MRLPLSVNFTINERTVTAEAGETILHCALRHDIQIPHLCDYPNLPPSGACRMCIVEIEGMRGYPTSCTIVAEEGMVIHTNTPELQHHRQKILELILLDHPSACLLCDKRELCEKYRPGVEKTGRTTGCHTCNFRETCELRKLTEEMEFKALSLPPTYREQPLERSDPFIDYDPNLCILCGRCVHTCEHHHGVPIIGFVDRGDKVHIGKALGRSLQEADCRFCGSCIDVCPTGALADRYAKWLPEPDNITETTCIFCNEACALEIGAARGTPISARAVNRDVPICVLGRFAIPEFLSGSNRLHVPYIRFNKNLREMQWEEALKIATEKLNPFIGDRFAFVCDTTSSLEDRYIFKKFTTEVMKSPHYIEIEPNKCGISHIKLPKGIKAALITGDFIDLKELEKLELLIVQDCYLSAVSDDADIVFPSAIFPEVNGTFVDANGVNRPLRKACNPPGSAKPDWQIISELARAMGAEGFAYNSVNSITKEIGVEDAKLAIEREEAPAAAADVKLRRTHFRGHRIDEKVKGLQALLVDDAYPIQKLIKAQTGFRILEKREIVPNMHEIVVEAPHIAKKARPGQFIILMVDEKSERVPYTLCDWDVEEGTITLIVQEVGRSSRKLVMLEANDKIPHLVGPLGKPFEIDNYGTVLLAGGCFGIGAIFPIARALKKAGNHVITVTEARSHYLHYFTDKLSTVSEELIQTSIDGSIGFKGHAVDVIAQKLENGEKIARVIAIGCLFMMMLVCEETKPYDVKTQVALNAIMVDGTGMCGACRVEVDGETKFACVDGPEFDGLKVNFDLLLKRQAIYCIQEKKSLTCTHKDCTHSIEKAY